MSSYIINLILFEGIWHVKCVHIHALDKSEFKQFVYEQ